MSKILEHFPLEKARRTQQDVLIAIEKAFKDGYKNVLLEAPVGSGKSAIAIAVSKYYGTAHVLTPRKSLQNQYAEDFSTHKVVLMKGRSSYPCSFPSADYNEKLYDHIVKEIKAGRVIQPTGAEPSCSEGPCLGSKPTGNMCIGLIKVNEPPSHPCPYHVAIDVAQRNDIIVHNLHSFIFQAYFASRFERRKIMIIDECHELENIIRGFASKKVVIFKNLRDEELPAEGSLKTLDDWTTWFEQYTSTFPTKVDKFGTSDRDKFLTLLEDISSLSDQFGEKFVTSIERDPILRRTRFIFTPEQVGSLVNKFILDFGEKRLLMSGTIYNKSLYCKNNGLNEEETCFIRIGSSFPKVNRPIYFKDTYKVDTSHKMWDQNFNSMIAKIKSVMEIFDDAKGLIHTPSYQASLTIFNALKSTGRVLTHTKDDFQTVLGDFYKSEEPKVLLSPVCQQGVDFKYDRARFQIVLRVPYANTSDAFVDHKVKNDFPWYNYQALVVFGQQIGRVNRAEDDFGVTVLMDERFGKFLSRNRNVLPKWLMEAVIYR